MSEVQKKSFQAVEEELLSQPLMKGLAPRVRAKSPRKSMWRWLKRRNIRELSFKRLIMGGRVSDAGRIGRYVIMIIGGLGVAWGPAVAYMKYGAVTYKSEFSLILPGAGSSTSISLSEIGQASSTANSAYASSTISPTVTYKNLLMSANVVGAAEASLGLPENTLEAPTVKLVDETSFITVSMVGGTGKGARDRVQAILDAFSVELNKLRQDELKRREEATLVPIKGYEKAVKEVRLKINAVQVATGLTSTAQFTELVTAAENLAAQIRDAESELSKLEKSRASLAASLKLDTSTAAITLKLHADPEFAILSDAASKAEADYAAVAQQFGAKHPKVIDAKAKRDGTRGQMLARATKITGVSAKKLVGRIDFAPTGQRSTMLAQLVSLSTDHAGLQGKLESMKADLKNREARITALVDVAGKLDSLDRDHKVAEAVFASALARINTSKTDIFASYPMIQVVAAPVIPMERATPNTKLAVGAAIGSTMLLFIAVMLGWLRRPIIELVLSKTLKSYDRPQSA